MTACAMDASFNSRVPTVCELARLGPHKAGPFVEGQADAIATAMIGADEATTRRLRIRMDALADAHHLYFREQPEHVQNAELARIAGNVERLRLDAFAARFERASR